MARFFRSQPINLRQLNGAPIPHFSSGALVTCFFDPKMPGILLANKYPVTPERVNGLKRGGSSKSV